MRAFIVRDLFVAGLRAGEGVSGVGVVDEGDLSDVTRSIDELNMMINGRQRRPFIQTRICESIMRVIFTFARVLEFVFAVLMRLLFNCITYVPNLNYMIM